MQIIKLNIAHDVTLEASDLSPTELAQLMILMSKCRIYRTTCDRIGETWVEAGYYKDVEIHLSRADVIIHADYEAAKAHLEMLRLRADQDDTSRVTALAA